MNLDLSFTIEFFEYYLSDPIESYSDVFDREIIASVMEFISYDSSLFYIIIITIMNFPKVIFFFKMLFLRSIKIIYVFFNAIELFTTEY